ncbi:458_t:CDS:1 [Paraglomus occultum]|uniref:458_t:CDS:1 n=1 Tax=Paraglomus occultum TaxID=144539 RepID=A0A9N9E337_9GLOM|nr:458_t:CDS:1 [Paraglomus occultum]
MPVRSRTPSCPSITPVSSRPGTPPCTVPSSPLSLTPSGIFVNTSTTGIPMKSSSIPMRSNSRPTTPIPSSPLCSPVQVGTLSPTIESAELPPLRSIAIPIRKATSNSTGYSSIPGTPISSSPLASCSSLASSPMYHGHLSSSPPNGHGYVHTGTSDHAPYKHTHTGIPLRSRASSYSLSSISRPSSPFRAATMHSLFHTEKITSVQN